MTNIPKGFRILPEEPTQQMKDAGALSVSERFRGDGGYCGPKEAEEFAVQAYRAMCAAAPASSCVGEAKPVCYGIFDKNGEMFWDDFCIGDQPGDIDALLDDQQYQEPERGWEIRPMFVQPVAPAHGWISARAKMVVAYMDAKYQRGMPISADEVKELMAAYHKMPDTYSSRESEVG